MNFWIAILCLRSSYIKTYQTFLKPLKRKKPLKTFFLDEVSFPALIRNVRYSADTINVVIDQQQIDPVNQVYSRRRCSQYLNSQSQLPTCQLARPTVRHR